MVEAEDPQSGDSRGAPCGLRGRRALVTGAAKRLGRAIALSLAEQGADVVVHYRSSQDEAREVAEHIRAMGRRAWMVQADFTKPAEAERGVGEACTAAGGLDILVNSASVFLDSRLADFRPEEFLADIQVNALAPALIARRFAAQCRQGHVVNLLDCRIVDYDAEHVAYHLSKRMLHAFTKMMALEFAPSIQVNAVAPGLILPPAGQTEEYLDALAETNPLKRHGDASDVAEAVGFLLRSRFITGQVIFVDGGRHLRGQMYG